MAKILGLFKKALSPVTESSWRNRARLVYWPRIKDPFLSRKFSLMLRRNARLADSRRRHAWQLLQRIGLSPEQEKLAQKYYETMRDYFQVCQDIRRELFGRKG
jgi:hypothetical protein